MQSKIVLWGVYLLQVSLGAFAADLKPDEFLLTFERYVERSGSRHSIRSESVIYEWGSSALQRLFFEAICRYSKTDCDKLSSEQQQRFQERSKWMVIDHERAKRLHYQIQGEKGQELNWRFLTRPSGADGRVEEIHTKKLDVAVGRELRMVAGSLGNGRSQFQKLPIVDMDEEGLSIISDVDDTIRKSHVLDKQKLLRTIFFEPFEVVPEVQKRIQEFRSGSEIVPLHFVSAGPRALYSTLREELDRNGLGTSEIYLRSFRFTDLSSFEFFKEDTFNYKVKTIQSIFERFPKRRFVLIGDSGEKDPEVYREIYKRYPKRVQKIIIRRVKGANNQEQRFRGLPCEFVDEESSSKGQACDKNLAVVKPRLGRAPRKS